jgi:hypothetical protein
MFACVFSKAYASIIEQRAFTGKAVVILIRFVVFFCNLVQRVKDCSAPRKRILVVYVACKVYIDKRYSPPLYGIAFNLRVNGFPILTPATLKSQIVKSFYKFAIYAVVINWIRDKMKIARS